MLRPFVVYQALRGRIVHICGARTKLIQLLQDASKETRCGPKAPNEAANNAPTTRVWMGAGEEDLGKASRPEAKGPQTGRLILNPSRAFPTWQLSHNVYRWSAWGRVCN